MRTLELRYHRTKTIDGEKFIPVFQSKKGYKAKARAALERRKGYKARVIYEKLSGLPAGWLVYRR